MSTKQHFGILKIAELVVVDCCQSPLIKAFHLYPIVNDVAKAIEGARLFELLLCFLYGSGHSKAETAALINFNPNI